MTDVPSGRASGGTPASRDLPIYAAGAVEVPWTIGLFDEMVDADTAWAAHAHPTHELLWNEHGVSTATVDRQTWTVTSRFGLWMPAGVIHSGSATAGTWYRAIHFGIHAMDSIADAPTTVEVTPLLRLLLGRLAETDLPAASRRVTEAMVLDVLVPSAQEIVVHEPAAPLLRPIVDGVRSQPGLAHALDDWARATGLSGRTISRTFRRETGLGFGRWVTTVRAQRAVDLLARGWDLEEVAHAVGYASASAFGAAFRRVTGATPGAFRDVRFATEQVH